MTPLAINPEKSIRSPGLAAMPEILDRGQWSRSFTYVLQKKGCSPSQLSEVHESRGVAWQTLMNIFWTRSLGKKKILQSRSNHEDQTYHACAPLAVSARSMD